MKNLSTKAAILFLCLPLSMSLAIADSQAAEKGQNCASSYVKASGEAEADASLKQVAAGTLTYFTRVGELPDLKTLAGEVELSQKALKEILKQNFTGKSYQTRIVSALLSNEKFFKKIRSDSFKFIKTFLTESLRFPSQEEVETNLGIPSLLLQNIWDGESLLFNDFLEENRGILAKLRKKMIDAYASETKRRSRPTPFPIWLALMGLPSDLSESELFHEDTGLFSDFTDLRNVAENLKPRHFLDVIDEDQFNDERLALFMSQVRNSKRLILTTAIAGAEVDQDFLESLETYCKEQNGILVIIPADRRTFRLDESLMNSPWIHPIINEIEFSRYLRLANARVMAKNFDPLTSLDRVGPRGQSVLVGSPKMFARVVPTVRNSTHPHILMSTGAITTASSYNSKIYRSQRGDYIAENDHVMGAVILELESSSAIEENADINPYHMRHIEYKPGRQGFLDLGKVYGPAGRVEEERPLAIVLGDLHLGDLDEEAKQKAFDLIETLKPRTVILHDSFNGHSVSHYTEKDFVEKMRQINEGRSDLAEELGAHVDFLNELLALDPNLHIVDNVSNHNLWLSRWIGEGGFGQAAKNAQIGLLLATAMAVENVENPIEFAATVLGTREENQAVFSKTVTEPDRVIFMKVGEHTRESERLQAILGSESDLGLELGLHGHVGANGARASVKSLQKAEDVIVFGHTHTYNRRNRAVNIGTMTKLSLGYNREGVSGWVQQLAIVGNHHEVQVLSYQNGEWMATDRNQVSPKAFTSNYPRAKPLPAPNEAEQMDQYTLR